MIQFTKVRWKNFMSFGNQMTEVILEGNSTTLIIGENGAGKSTLLDAICYTLYAKSFRNVSAGSLINSINNKDCVTEIEFKIGTKNYRVQRKMKPGGFKMWCDGEQILAGSSHKEHQAVLEDKILKMRFNTFKQVVLLGSANHVAFMMLPTWQRRQIVEDLLDIQVFGVMNDLLRIRSSENKTQMQDTTHDKEMTGQKIRLVTSHIEGLQKQKDDYLDKQKGLIDDTKDKIKSEEEFIEAYRTKNDEIARDIAGLAPDPDKIDSISDLLYKLKSNIEGHKKSLDFFHDSDSCPTCQQELGQEIRETKVSEYQGKIDEQTGAIESLKKQQSDLQTVVERHTQLTDRMNKHLEKIDGHKKNIELLQEQINRFESDTKDADFSELKEKQKELDKSQKLIERLEDEYKDLIHKKHLYDLASKLLKDDGVKAQIIKQYIPVINKTCNTYLQRMGLPIRFDLDEQFKEIVRSRYQDEFKYESFSMGERQRIDLAMLLTWRAIAKSRNSASTNLLILDETFDSSLDMNGTDELIKILYDMTGSNIIVISHKMGDSDKFSRTIQAKKKGNFSQLFLEN